MTDIGAGLICIANFALHHRIAEIAEVAITQIEKRGLEIPPDLHFRRVLFNLEDMVDGLTYQQPDSFKELQTSIESFESILEDAKVDKYQFFRIQKAIVNQGAVAKLAAEFLSSDIQEPSDPSNITVSKKFKEGSFVQMMDEYFRSYSSIYQKHTLELEADIRKFTRDIFAEAPSNTRKGPKRTVQKVLIFDIFASLPLEEFKQRIVKFFRQLIGRLVAPDPLGAVMVEFRSPVPLGDLEQPNWTGDQARHSGPYSRHPVPPSPITTRPNIVSKPLQSPDRKQSLEPGDLQAASRRFQDKYNQKDPLKDIKDIHLPETQQEEDEDQVATQKQLAVGKKRDRPSSTVASTTTTAGSTKASSRLPLDAKRSSSSKIEFQDLETQESEDEVDSPVQPRKAAKTTSVSKSRRSRRLGNIDDIESEDDEENALTSLTKKVQEARTSRRPTLPPTLNSPPATSPVTAAMKRASQTKRTPIFEDKNSSRTKWSYDEEEALRGGVQKHGVGKWREIKSDPDFAAVLKKRDPVQLKDKYRNLWKKDLI